MFSGGESGGDENCTVGNELFFIRVLDQY